MLPTKGFSIKPLKVKLLAGEQKATEKFRDRLLLSPFTGGMHKEAPGSKLGPYMSF